MDWRPQRFINSSEADLSLTLTNIPKIMRVQGWTRGARLMEKWFHRAAVQSPQYSAPDTRTIKVDWVLGYAKPKELYDSIFTERIWANDAAKKVLAKRLRDWGKLTGFRELFDQTLRPARTLETEYINFRGYGGGYSGYSGYSGASGYSSSNASGNAVDLYSGIASTGLNDLIAALGAFTFRVVVGGSVVPVISGGHEVTIDKVGVYIRDSYDFEGFQFLGFWDDADNSVSAVNPLAGSAVFNSSFRDYRDQNHMGGDFMIYSNVKTTMLNPPHKFML